MFSMAIALLTLLVASGCGASEDDLAPRLARLEGRLAALEERLGSFATLDDLGEQAARLERQLAAARSPTLAPAVAAKPRPVPTPVPPAIGGFPDVPRLEHLNELSAEYREKLTAIQKRYADDPTAPQRLREIHELRSWFYDELRTAQAEGAAVPNVPE